MKIKLLRISAIGLAVMLACVNLVVSQERPKRPALSKLPAGVHVLRDLQYVEGGHERNRLDLYQLVQYASPRVYRSCR